MKHLVILISCLSFVFACNKAPSDQKTTNPSAKKEAPKAETPKAEAPKATPSKRVFFVEPKAGAKVKSPIKVVFGLEGMTISPAGQNMGDKTKGHHHLVVDGKSIPAGQMVPMNKTHIHFGKGQTETSLELAPGKHTLTLQFADAMHMSYGPDMSATIDVEVTP